MPRTKEQNKLIKDKRKNQIMGVALKLFCEHGYDVICVDDICKKAHISHGLFYHYFSSKEDIKSVIIEYGKEKAFATRAPFLDPNLTGLDFFRQANESLIGVIKSLDTPMYYEYYLIQELFKVDISSKLLKEKGKPDFSVFQKMYWTIVELQESKVFIAGNPKTIFYTYITVLLGIMTMNMIGKLKVGRAPDSEIVMNLLYRKKED